jgi:hypothetical protein
MTGHVDSGIYVQVSPELVKDQIGITDRISYLMTHSADDIQRDTLNEGRSALRTLSYTDYSHVNPAEIAEQRVDAEHWLDEDNPPWDIIGWKEIIR